MRLWMQLLKTYLIYGTLLGLLFGGIYFHIYNVIASYFYFGGMMPPVLAYTFMFLTHAALPKNDFLAGIAYLPHSLVLGGIIGALFAIWNWLFIVLLLNKRPMPKRLYKYASSGFTYLSTFAAVVIFTALFNQFLDEPFNQPFLMTVYTLAVGGVCGLLPAMLNKQLVMKYHSQYVAKAKTKRR